MYTGFYLKDKVTLCVSLRPQWNKASYYVTLLYEVWSLLIFG